MLSWSWWRKGYWTDAFPDVLSTTAHSFQSELVGSLSRTGQQSRVRPQDTNLVGSPVAWGVSQPRSLGAAFRSFLLPQHPDHLCLFKGIESTW